MSVLKINGKDIADLNLEVVEAGGIWSRPTYERDDATLAGLVGSRPSEVAGSPSKVVPLVLSLAGTTANRRARLDSVLWALDGLLVLEWDDATDRVQYGRVNVAEIRERWGGAGLGFLSTAAKLSIGIDVVLDTPLSFDKEVTTLAIAASGEADCEIGTAPVGPLLEFPAATGTITVTYKNGMSGATVGTPLSISNPGLGATESLLVDCAAQRIYKHDGASATTSMATLYATGDFPVVDPGDGDPDNSVYPIIKASHECFIVYRRAWE